MEHKRLKNWIWIGAAIALLAAIGIGLFLWLSSQKPDAKALLEQAETLSAQNLCLQALLEEQPENTAYQQQLLDNYAVLDADPLTIYAMEQSFGLSAPADLPKAAEQAGAVLNRGGIAGMRTYKDAYSVAQGSDTTYYATEEGIYADYQGLRRKIASIGASHLLAAENGLYYLNDIQRKVQYIARDGHKIETLSMQDAQSFALFNDALWIIDPQGQLYCNDQPIRTEQKVRALAATPDRLYAACNDEKGAAAGVLAIDKAGAQTTVLTSPARSIFGGADGCLYYINDFELPMRYDPISKEAVILQQKAAISVTYENDAIFVLNQKGKVKKITAD